MKVQPGCQLKNLFFIKLSVSVTCRRSETLISYKSISPPRKEKPIAEPVPGSRLASHHTPELSIKKNTGGFRGSPVNSLLRESH
mmetsp:Transcript_16364/g.39164  ORF Transcript_16364/g.39164 Transcript_16364/m.39164 type:complete len:84 (-) Transcript_16364:994-1245(-)